MPEFITVGKGPQARKDMPSNIVRAAGPLPRLGWGDSCRICVGSKAEAVRRFRRSTGTRLPCASTIGARAESEGEAFEDGTISRWCRGSDFGRHHHPLRGEKAYP